MVDKLNEELIAEYKASFDLIDRDLDGQITIKEIENIMKALGEDYNQVEIQEMIEEIDIDGNKALDFKEFVGLMTRTVKDIDLDDELLEAYKVFDKDGNGYITLDELKETIYLINNQITEEEVKEMLNEVDEDKDGKINFDDFMKIMKNN